LFLLYIQEQNRLRAVLEQHEDKAQEIFDEGAQAHLELEKKRKQETENKRNFKRRKISSRR
jgi:hypothetical protein